MKELTATNVHDVFRKCLFNPGEDTSAAVIVEGIMSRFGFHPERLESNKQDVIDMLGQLPESFDEDKGGGMSFLNACVRRDGVQWGEHPTMELLFVLGMAVGRVKLCAPRSMWTMMPGGMPYFAITATPLNENQNDREPTEVG
jgi:hypothetical protein